jgi:Phytanoyl-CoA dioxygenase (PhyH)
MVPHSHKMFSPYRGISFPQQFDSISDTVRKYLVPIEMKAGDILLFDNRLVHNSLINSSGRDRIVIMSGIFPKEASILSCYKDPADTQNLIELIEQDDDFLLTFENFFHDCTCRPDTGRSIGNVRWDVSQMSEKTFFRLCRKYGVKELDHPATRKNILSQAIIGEPVA